jgi:hypothetical protein
VKETKAHLVSFFDDKFLRLPQLGREPGIYFDLLFLFTLPQRLPKAQVGTITGGQHTSGGRNIQNRSKSYDRKLQRQRYKILQRQE